MNPVLLAAIFAAVPNSASGGTYSTFTSGGATWARHVFTTAGTLTVTSANRPFIVTVVGGGGGGGAPADGFGAGAGTRGGFYSAATTLPVGALTVTVGTGGTSGGPVQVGGGTGAGGGAGGDSSITGAWTAGGGGGGSGGPSGTGGANRTGSPSPAADGGVTTIDYASHGLASTVGAGGIAAVGPYPGSSATAGQNGAVVIEYII